MPAAYFFEYFVQTDENEIVVPMHGVSAMQCHRSGETAGYDDGQRLADLEKEAIYHAVDRRSGTENGTGAHAVDCVFADSRVGRSQCDMRQLSRAFGEGAQTYLSPREYRHTLKCAVLAEVDYLGCRAHIDDDARAAVFFSSCDRYADKIRTDRRWIVAVYVDTGLDTGSYRERIYAECYFQRLAYRTGQLRNDR